MAKHGNERCVDCGTEFTDTGRPRFTAPLCPGCQARDDAEYAVDPVSLEDFTGPRPWSREAMKERLGISRGNEDV